MVHKLKLQMELFDGEKIQEQANEQFAMAIRRNETKRTSATTANGELCCEFCGSTQGCNCLPEVRNDSAEKR